MKVNMKLLFEGNNPIDKVRKTLIIIGIAWAAAVLVYVVVGAVNYMIGVAEGTQAMYAASGATLSFGGTLGLICFRGIMTFLIAVFIGWGVLYIVYIFAGKIISKNTAPAKGNSKKHSSHKK